MAQPVSSNLEEAREAVGEYLLRIPQVEAVTGLGRNTIWSRIREGRFPNSVELGGGRVAWTATSVRDWMDGLQCTDDHARKARYGGRHFSGGRSGPARGVQKS